MKKGYVVLMLSLMSLMLVSIGLVSAALELCPADNVNSLTGCVCGHSPNSTLGYGQVIIGGATPSIISCNNMGDAVCPEDFTDPSTGLSANCGNCPDADCTVNNSANIGYVWGYVNDINSKRVENVIVTGHPIKWNNSANLDRSALPTDSYGKYNSTAFISGKYYFSASKKGYDTQLLEATIVRGQVTRLDFQLLNGTCHDDCTNSYNRCNAECDGVTFNDSSTKCSFYNTIVRDACNNRLKETKVKLEGYPGNTPTETYFVDCCEGTPQLQRYVKAKPDTNAGWIKNLIKTEKIARLDDYPMRIVVAYWTKE